MLLLRQARTLFFSLLLLAAALACACAPGGRPPVADPIALLLDESLAAPEPPAHLATLDYTVQVGAFAAAENALRLEARLQALGIDAYHFRHPAGLYKVRFGNYRTDATARREAEGLRTRGLIGPYFIVAPEDHAAVRIARGGSGDLREELVATARRFLGIPYRWGGTDASGFDCSGLTMVCYRLNGLDLPRVSRSQFRAGRSVPRQELKKGDLVFFATGSGSRVTHVGLYIGAGRFIHAPRTGKTVRVAELDAPYFSRTFVGGRSYL